MYVPRCTTKVQSVDSGNVQVRGRKWFHRDSASRTVPDVEEKLNEICLAFERAAHSVNKAGGLTGYQEVADEKV